MGDSTAETDAPEPVRVVEAVLADHRSWPDALDGCIGCGWRPDNPAFAGAQHRRHVAARVIAALTIPPVREGSDG